MFSDNESSDENDDFDVGIGDDVQNVRLEVKFDEENVDDVAMREQFGEETEEEMDEEDVSLEDSEFEEGILLDNSTLHEKSRKNQSKEAKAEWVANLDESSEESSNDDDTEEGYEDNKAQLEYFPAGLDGKYVAPQRREERAGLQEPTLTNDAEVERLIRRCLNRLSSENFEPLVKELVSMMEAHSSQVVCQTLTKEMLKAVGDNGRLLTDLTCMYAFVVAGVHTHCGLQVVAVIVEHVVRAHQKAFAENQEREGMNYLLLIAHLYNLQILHCTLVYDIVNFMCRNFSTSAISQVHLILKNVGLNLRSDDPRALKDMILLVQESATANGVSEEGRSRFLLEMVYSLKNNKAIGGGAEIFGGERYTLMHNSLKNLKSQAGNTGKLVEQMLQASLAELLDAKKQGKWWLHSQIKLAKEAHSSAAIDAATISDSKVLALARKYRMNTDVRKAIFCTIMTSEDYMDAFESLSKLGLKGKQTHEMPRVIMACLAQERVYNPYYACLAQKLCKESRSSTFTFQLCLWDAVKVLQETAVKAVSHMARFYCHLIGQGSVPISCLKVISWEAMSPKENLFGALCVGTLLVTFSEQQVVKIFRRIKSNQDLDLLSQGLQIYLKNQCQKNATQTSQICVVDPQLLAARAKLASRALKMNCVEFADLE